ncbi:MAG: alanine--tRNA ligase [Deltaproteobacteria bacterium]|jgi:alanyl-tRNA synthetase|nr:alanine--tRNA ligase [Deltaproteobacteria bacterium]
MLSTNEIRRRFLAYFRERGHEMVRSSSLVPRDDPTLLFTNAGMVQFKQIFQGLEKRPYSRAVTAQKCLRVGGKHNDLENVGRTARHHTFFEMLGNFSFGDYFKAEAIKYAWDFVTGELGLPPDKLYITVYRDDDEAAELWLRHSSVPAERILRMGEKDNFWSMGDTGPCGPCSEILIDQGEQMRCGPDCGIGRCDCDRFLEIWNLVFMQYNQLEPGKRELLPRPSIDTGMGLERVSAVCQGVYSNYDTDLFQSIIKFTADLAGIGYSRSAPNTNDTDTALRVIADHSRAVAFMIADGIMPSNEGRGYILRRLIRRAFRFGRLLGLDGAFLHKSVLTVVEHMREDFPELQDSASFMARVVREEEERFEKTLDKGLALLEDELDKLPAGKRVLSGDVAFKLYDTFGFPLDIINDVAAKEGISIDEAGFKALMLEQKKRARESWKGSGESDPATRFAELLEEGLRSEFTGYSALRDSSRIIALLNGQGERVSELGTGASGWLACARTPFYGASGGQTGDTGKIVSSSGTALVLDTQRPSLALTVHRVEIGSGFLFLDAEAELEVDAEKRLAASRNHTCTHLLHAALRSVLGGHARQAGSLVDPERLRFDFTHSAALKEEELAAVEERVNRAIMADLAVETHESSYAEAVGAGAIALFGEKYGETVRSVRIEDESTELCGGTHLQRTGQAGFFSIISESGIGSGLRRIEGATGWGALRLYKARQQEARALGELLKARPGELLEKTRILYNEVRALRKDLEKAAGRSGSGQGEDLLSGLREINGLRLLTARSSASDIKALREIADDVRSRLASGIACLTAEGDGKVSMILTVSKDLSERFPAPELIREIAREIGGSGGGRPDMAQAGGNNPGGIDAAFALLTRRLQGN